MSKALEVSIGSLRLENPLLCASGTFGYGEEASAFVDPSIYGALIGKSISPLPRKGNPLPRLAETPSGMLNSIGLQNPGIDVFIGEYLPRMRRFDSALIVNLVGDTIDEYVGMAERLAACSEVDALELNISCPNCPLGGMEFGIDPGATERLVRAVREAFERPIIAKLTPNVTDIVPIARAAEAGGADAVSAINTYVGLSVDWRRRRPRLGGVTGGLSGPAIKPLALRLVWMISRNVRIPVIGIGGIMTADDVLEFLVAGASAVQLGTVQFLRPRAAVEILATLEQVMREGDGTRPGGFSSLCELVGTLETGREAITVSAPRGPDTEASS